MCGSVAAEWRVGRGAVRPGRRGYCTQAAGGQPGAVTFAHYPGARRGAGGLIAPQPYPGTLLWFLVVRFLSSNLSKRISIMCKVPRLDRDGYCRPPRSQPQRLEARAQQSLARPTPALRRSWVRRNTVSGVRVCHFPGERPETHARPPPESTPTASRFVRGAGRASPRSLTYSPTPTRETQRPPPSTLPVHRPSCRHAQGGSAHHGGARGAGPGLTPGGALSRAPVSPPPAPPAPPLPLHRLHSTLWRELVPPCGPAD